jgi:hypothetical protein
MLPAMRPTLRRSVTLSAALVATLVLAGRAQAGVTLVMQRGSDTTSTLYVDGDKMRMENPGGKERVVIIDAAGKRMIMVNEAEKTYSEVTEADMKRFGEMMKQQRAAMAERMKTMPPEQRKHMEQIMGAQNANPPELKFEKMGSKKSVNGFSCEMYRVLEDGTPKEEDCLSPWSSSLLQRSDFLALRKFAEEMAKDSGMMGPGRQMFEQFDKYPGFPVTRHPLEPGPTGVREDEQLKSVKRGSIPASTFAAPAGYTKTQSPMGAFGGGAARPKFRPAPPTGQP